MVRRDRARRQRTAHRLPSTCWHHGGISPVLAIWAIRRAAWQSKPARTRVGAKRREGN